MPSTHLDKALEQPTIKMYRWKAHNDWVEQITIDRRLNQIISCSNDEHNAVIIGCILPGTDLNSHLQSIEKQTATQTVNTEAKESKDSTTNQAENSTFLNTSFDASNKRNSTVGNANRISTPKQPAQDQQHSQSNQGNMTVSSNSRDVKRRPESSETVFKVNKGVKTFDFSFEKNILITGG